MTETFHDKVIVSKFGGSSLAETSHFVHVRDIILRDPRRQYVVVSALGKRSNTDYKITDKLLECVKKTHCKQSIIEEFIDIKQRYIKIVEELDL